MQENVSVKQLRVVLILLNGGELVDCAWHRVKDLVAKVCIQLVGRLAKRGLCLHILGGLAPSKTLLVLLFGQFVCFQDCPDSSLHNKYGVAQLATFLCERFHY